MTIRLETLFIYLAGGGGEARLGGGLALPRRGIFKDQKFTTQENSKK